MRGGLDVDSRCDNAAPHVGCDAVFVPVLTDSKKYFTFALDSYGIMPYICNVINGMTPAT
jgi:hypothetical protein